MRLNILLGLFVGALSACSVSKTATNATSGSSADDGEVENIPDTDAFQVAVNTNTNYDVTISKNGDGSTECQADEGDDILCIVDMHELDLYARGYTINDATPADLCEYRGFYPYFYNIAPVGREPTAIFYEEDAEGVLLAPTTAVPASLATKVAATAAGDRDDVWYFIDDGDFTVESSDWYSHLTLYGAAATAFDDFRCPFNYSDVVTNGKNCCDGEYTLMSRSDGEVDNQSGQEWGGSVANCFEGPGIDTYTTLGEDGLPLYLITTVDTDAGNTGTFSVASPISKDEVDNHQVYAANYYQASEHSSDVPGPTKVIRGYRSQESSAHFLYECLDSNFEVKARIRVVAREWNLKDELTDWLALGGLGTAADQWDSEGTESALTNSESDSVPGVQSCYNDFWDWKDIEEADTATSCYLDDGGLSYTSFGFATLATPTDIIPYNHNGYLGFAD